MKKIFIALFAATLLIPCLRAQEPGKYSAFQFGIVPGLSSNGKEAGQYTNGASFNLFAGVSYRENAFTFASLGNIINENAYGFQFAGLFNIIKGNSSGFQFGGLWNYVNGHGGGFLFSGLANIAAEMDGVQFAGLCNGSRRVNGLQFSGLLNHSVYLAGFQFAGLVNLTNAANGFQFGGLVNKAEKINGFQFAGVANVAAEVDGFQFAGLGNVSRRVNGFQFAGLFNVADRVSGVQFAGLVNVARSSDVPIGIVNIIREGSMALGAVYNETGSMLAELRSGGRVSYGIFGWGYNHKVKEATMRAGYGFHINCTRWLTVNNEFTGEFIGNFSSDDPAYKTSYYLLPSFRPFRFLEVFGGPGISFMETKNKAYANLFPSHSLWKRDGDRTRQLFVGWQAGLHFYIW